MDPTPEVVKQEPPAVTPPAPSRPWPATRRDAIADTVQGTKIADPYRWLEDEKSPEVQAWMNQQDGYARAELAKLPKRAELSERLKKLLYFDAINPPRHRKGRYFYSRKHVDKEKSVVYWRQGRNDDRQGAEKVLLDPNAWSADGTKGLGVWFPSQDGKHVVYNVKLNNSDEAEAKILEVATGKDLAETIPGTKYGGMSWTPDGKGFYYTWQPPVSPQVPVADRPGFAEIRFHRLGTDPAKDEVIHPATKDPKTFLHGSISRDGKWLTASIQRGWNSTDWFFRDARKKDAKWTPLVSGVDAIFVVDVWRDRFYVTTNHEAPLYRVFKVDPKRPDRASWKEIVPQSDATLESATIVGERLALQYLRNATSQLEIRDLEGKPLRKVELPGIGTVRSVIGNEDEDTAYFDFVSFTEPQIIYQTSIKSGKVREWARVKLPIDTSGMVSEQVFYPSKDGTKISMFIIRKQDVKKDGKNPTILSGYGGFNVNITPTFSATRALWIERGGVYAIPNLRGGGEYGEEWHRAGMLLDKQNVFDDFIAAAEYLVKEGWTAPAHLGIQGGSNGGLLVGAALTQRPELFKAVGCGVPLLDMLRYHLFASGKTWIPEYGSAEDPAQFKALYAYSPYRRAVDAGPVRYPAVLFDSSDHDDRVDPMHARKLAALLQHAQTGSGPVLLRIERNAGHGGADMVKEQVARGADTLAFFAEQLR